MWSPLTATQPFWLITPLTDAERPLPYGAAIPTPVCPAQKYWLIQPPTGHARYPPAFAAGGLKTGRAVSPAARARTATGGPVWASARWAPRGGAGTHEKGWVCLFAGRSTMMRG